MTKEDREEIQKMIDDAISKLNFLKPYDPSEIRPYVPYQPFWPSMPAQSITLPDMPSRSGGTTCSKCGMDWSGAMGYCCPSFDCPMQPKATY